MTHDYHMDELTTLTYEDLSLKAGLELRKTDLIVLQTLQYLIVDRATIEPHLTQINDYLKESVKDGEHVVWDLFRSESSGMYIILITG